MTRTLNMGRLPRPLSAGSLQRLELTTSSKPPASSNHVSNRNARQLPPRAAAALSSFPQQPCMVHGCPLTGHLKLDTSSVGEVNHRIKLSAQWGDVAKVVAEMGERLQPSNIAYALYRLGCLFTFLSSQRKTALEKSGVLERLVAMAAKRVSSFGPSELTFVLDGMARLEVKAPAAFMSALAQRAAVLAQELEADQVPLVYWAFATLGYCPSHAVLAKLDARVLSIAPQLSAQGLTLVLQSCCGLQHQPAEGLLEALAGAMRLTLECFKRAELASCLDSFKALGFYPGNDLMQDIARVTGVRVPPGALRSESEPVLANNVILGRPGLNSPGLALSSQGALQRARDVTAASAEQLLSAGSAAGATLVKGQQAIAGTAHNAVHSQASPARLSPRQGGGKPRLSPLNAAGSHSRQRRSSEDPCTYWRFRGRQDFIDHVQTHR